MTSDGRGSDGAPGGAFVPSHIDIAKAGVAPRGTAFVLHGILGSAANWRSFVRRLVESSAMPAAAELRWVLVDLRAHGESALASPAAAPPNTVAACAEDLARLARRLGVTVDLILGHSFGGKVALEFAARHSPATRACWLLDTPPGPAAITGPSAGVDEIARVFEVIEAIPEPLPGRAEVAAAITAQGLSDALAQWMTTNIRGSADAGYHWKFDLPSVRDLVADYARLDLWPDVEHPRPGLAVHAVRGARSNRFTAADVARLDRLGAGAIAIPDAGHWLHVDAPGALARVFESAAREVLGAA